MLLVVTVKLPEHVPEALNPVIEVIKISKQNTPS